MFDTNIVLCEIPSLVNGRNQLTGVIPAAFKNTVITVKPQVKSTIATEDPIFGGAALYYK
jgi:hypothetical protein